MKRKFKNKKDINFHPILHNCCARDDDKRKIDILGIATIPTFLHSMILRFEHSENETKDTVCLFNFSFLFFL